MKVVRFLVALIIISAVATSLSACEWGGGGNASGNASGSGSAQP